MVRAVPSAAPNAAPHAAGLAGRRARRGRRHVGWRLTGVAVAGLLAVAALAIPGAGPAPDTRSPEPAGGVSATPPPPPLTVASTVPGRWARVLHDLDRRRARAFEAGDPGALRAVYLRGSAVLARERATLAAYAARGLTVSGAMMRLLDVRARRSAPGRVVLRVVDRLQSTTAQTATGVVAALPRDRPTVHRVVLQRVGGRWLIAALTALTG